MIGSGTPFQIYLEGNSEELYKKITPLNTLSLDSV